MKRKHAIVIALSFVLVGMMFFSVDIPMVSNHQEVSQSVPSPQEVTQIADEPDSSGKMLMNVNENPSFEDWASDRPSGYDWAYASTYQHTDFTYHGVGITGTYAAQLEAESSSTHGGAASASYTVPSSPSPLIEPGMSLTFDWITLENEPYDQGARVYVEIQTFDGVSKHRNFWYYLSSNWESSNGSIDATFYINETIGEWHSFNRNLTADYIAVWGAGDLSSSQYIQLMRLRVYSYPGDPGLISAAFDEVVLTNGTYSSWVTNGDFENGVGTPWSGSDSSRGYLEQSTDSMHETYSMNMSVPDCTDGGGNVNTRKNWNYPFTYFASTPGMMYIDIDWKYSDTDTIYGQNGRLLLSFRNSTGTFYFYLFFGTMDDTFVGWSNSSTTFAFLMPGFGIKDTWQHSRIDVYDYLSSVGISNVSLYQTEFVIQNDALGESNSLLVDDFQITTFPLGDPGFEEDWYSSSSTPFAGWPDLGGETGVISRTTDSLLGNYACNLTVIGPDGAGVYRTPRLLLHPSDLTNFSWRLDDMGVGSSNVFVTFHFADDTYILYLLGSGSGFTMETGPSAKLIDADSYNVTGVWNLLQVNLTADAEEAFGPLADTTIIEVMLNAYAGSGDRVSVIFDEIHFIDGALPVIDSVDFLPVAPMYYDTVDVTVYTHDDRSGIELVYVDYYDGSWHSLSATDMGAYFAATIPVHAYDTTVEFQVSVFDGSGNNALDNNGGARYSYTVGDDVIPVVSFTSPTFFEEVEGQVLLDLSAEDSGSGVAFVEFYLDDGATMPLLFNDTVAPYEYTWDSDTVALGDYTIYANVVDNAGMNNVDIVNVTVVDTIAPVLDSPTDVAFDEGEMGYTIDWNPTDVRPTSYEVFIEEVSTFTGAWNSSSEHIVIDLDNLAVGTYNYTCMVYDGAGHSAVDTVIVTVNEVVTISTTETTTTETTTTDTSTTDTTTTTTGGPTGGGDIMTPLLIVVGIGVAGIVLIVFVVLPKMKKS